MPVKKGKYERCPYPGDCCMRDGAGRCLALSEVRFKDGKCHFRKKVKFGPNLYDHERRRKNGK